MDLIGTSTLDAMIIFSATKISYQNSKTREKKKRKKKKRESKCFVVEAQTYVLRQI